MCVNHVDALLADETQQPPKCAEVAQRACTEVHERRATTPELLLDRVAFNRGEATDRQLDTASIDRALEGDDEILRTANRERIDQPEKPRRASLDSHGVAVLRMSPAGRPSIVSRAHRNICGSTSRNVVSETAAPTVTPTIN